MSFDQEIGNLRTRLAEATSERDHWRFSARQEKYFEAHRLVHALEQELVRLRRQGLKSTVRGERAYHKA